MIAGAGDDFVDPAFGQQSGIRVSPPVTRPEAIRGILELGLKKRKYRERRHGQNAPLAVRLGYPHWMMLAGAILVALGFIGFAFQQNRNAEPPDHEPPEMLNGK